MRRNQISVRLKTVKMRQKLFKVTDVSFHAAMQKFSPLLSGVVDNGLLRTGPLSNQTRVQYTNK